MKPEPPKFERLVYNPPSDPLRILHRDDDLLVLSKPTDLLSVPGKLPGLHDSLQTRAVEEFPEALLVHRLDMDTSGVFLMALNKRAQSLVSKQFQYRKTDKHYIAKIWGAPPEATGTVDLPLRCDWDNRPLQIVCHEHGRPSQTHWEVLESADGVSCVKLTPVTGRSHQLRVHMAELGCPILGDPFYAHEEARGAADRLLLHAESLTIYHPTTNERVTFSDPAPF